eukprot:CAMPEP_0117463874 /NCGR_PEP_ID=MMETSP0784-20121206/3808_1 /TAXON_ID=39447 /ORGANISM="" /LENGTH=115 /DNA_ID=CAMNT_0005257711 /DNA_START=155 /DNA_END=503 /DNA_ORIENTATION=-
MNQLLDLLNLDELLRHGIEEHLRYQRRVRQTLLRQHVPGGKEHGAACVGALRVHGFDRRQRARIASSNKLLAVVESLARIDTKDIGLSSVAVDMCGTSLSSVACSRGVVAATEES